MGLVGLFLVGCQQESEAPFKPELPGNIEENLLEGEYIVVFKETTFGQSSDNRNRGIYSRGELVKHFEGARIQHTQAVADLAGEYGIESEQIDEIHVAGINGFSANLSPQQANRLANDERVAFVEQDYLFDMSNSLREMPLKDLNEEGGRGTLASLASSQTVPCGVSSVGGFVDASQSSNWIWLIGGGADPSHPDLNVITERPFAKRNNRITDAGTHLAGCAAAKDNGVGVVGVAAGAPVVNVPLRRNRVANLIGALVHVAKYYLPGDVVHIGYAYKGFSPAAAFIIKRLADRGVRFSIAAGDAASDAGMYFPGNIEYHNVYTVSAGDCDLHFASFSNYNNPPVDLRGVGVDALSTSSDRSFMFMTGTSVSSAYVAGYLLTVNTVQICGTINGDPDGDPDGVPCRGFGNDDDDDDDDDDD